MEAGYGFIDHNGDLKSDIIIPYKRIGFKHPTTSINIQSITIPNYHKVLEYCLNSHKIYPFVKFIGWDVAIDESSEPKLIE